MKKDHKILKTNLSTLLKRFAKTDVVSTLKESYNPTIVNQISTSLLKDLPFFQDLRVSDDRILRRLSLIEDNGLTNPLMVIQDGNQYFVITSRTSFYACKKLNKATIPCIVVDIPKQDLLLMLASNLRDNKNSSIIEIFYVLKELKDAYKYTQKELSMIMEVSRSQITNILRINKLSKKVKDLLNDNVVTFTQIRPLLTLKNEKLEEIIQKIINEKLSVREIEKLVQNLKKTNTYKDEENLLSSLYNANVSISKNKIVLMINNNDNIQELIDKLKVKKRGG